MSYLSCSDPSLSLRHSSIPTSRMGSPAPVGGAGALVIPRGGTRDTGVWVLPPARCAWSPVPSPQSPARYTGFRIRAVRGCVSRLLGVSERLFQAESSFEPSGIESAVDSRRVPPQVVMRSICGEGILFPSTVQPVWGCPRVPFEAPGSSRRARSSREFI